MEENQMASGERATGGSKVGRIDKTLLELSVGILFWGIVCQAAGIWPVGDKMGYSIGLWIGVFMAVAAGTHMWWALDKSLDFAGGVAVKMITKYNIIRYAAIVVEIGRASCRERV